MLQIQGVFLALGDYMNVDCHACIGGTNVREDMKRISNGVQVIVGTPGRVYDMIKRGALSMFFLLIIFFKAAFKSCAYTSNA